MPLQLAVPAPLGLPEASCLASFDLCGFHTLGKQCAAGFAPGGNMGKAKTQAI
jgi:hypothetical protein